MRRFAPGGLQSSYQEDVFERTQGHFKHSPCDYAWFNFTCYHPPPGQPRGQVQPFGPGGGELFEAVARGEGVGQIKNNFLLFL